MPPREKLLRPPREKLWLPYIQRVEASGTATSTLYLLEG
jgi:hypothetical protein